MIKIEEYLLLSLEERQLHLKLDDPCIERGGPEKGGLSSYCKGLMAHVHDTTIPSGMKIHVCHACNNGRCCNPNHLYWGTAKENYADMMANGGKTLWEKCVEKYGLDEAKRRNKRIGNQNGKGQIGIPKTDEHKVKLSKALEGNSNAKK